LIKKMVKENIKVYQEVDVEVYETEDGRQFKIEEEAIEHEKVGMIKSINIDSEIINNSYLTQYIEKFKWVHFLNENQVEAYEQQYCGNKDDNTWGSWVSCKQKFNFPCWVMCYYVPHSLSEHDFGDDDYTAIYMTLDEVEVDLTKVINKLNSLR